MDEAKIKALDGVMAQIEKQYGKGAIMRLGQDAAENNVEVLPTGCLSLDLAIDPEAAAHKGAEGRKIVGDADVLLFPDIHAGNLVYKCLVHTADVKNGCILTGTKAPAILTSRSDSFETKVNSIALAAVVAEAMKK